MRFAAFKKKKSTEEIIWSCFYKWKIDSMEERFFLLVHWHGICYTLMNTELRHQESATQNCQKNFYEVSGTSKHFTKMHVKYVLVECL